MALLGCLLILGSGCRRRSETVVVLHAGSLSPLISETARRFQENNPGVRIQSEPSGSLDALRKITELGKPCDLVATADARLIPYFLSEHLQRYYSFLGNEMVLAAAREDRFGGLRTQWESAWYELLFRGETSYGISDPDRDPAGYYAHLAWKLAEIHYNQPGLYRRFLRRLEVGKTRPKSSELIALLQTGNLDFAFLYKSSAIQNNLPFITLPPQVSLGEESYSDLYRRVFVTVSGKTPGTTVEIVGGPIRYGLAILSESNSWARQYSDFLFSPESQPLYRELGYTVVPITEVAVGKDSP